MSDLPGWIYLSGMPFMFAFLWEEDLRGYGEGTFKGRFLPAFIFSFAWPLWLLFGLWFWWRPWRVFGFLHGAVLAPMGRMLWAFLLIPHKIARRIEVNMKDRGDT